MLEVIIGGVAIMLMRVADVTLGTFRTILVVIIRRRDLKMVQKIIDVIDPKAFVTIQHSRPYRGFIHGSRK